jgi:transmembrane sensor
MSATTAASSNKSPRAARAEASVWIVRLHSEERTAELESGLRTWLAADPENARQFEHITDVWELGGVVTADGLPRMRSWGARSSKSRWVLATAAMAVCLIASFTVYWWWVGSAYVTAHGEQRLVYLDDGSRVYLNSDSRLRIEFKAYERRVRLERGEGFFEVAKDPARLFIVEAGDRRITALGTSFVVRYEPTRTAVTLVEGRVSISPLTAELTLVANTSETSLAARQQPASRASGPAEPEVITLTPGERLTMGDLAPPQLDVPRLEAVTAWRRGEVLLEATPLDEAVAEMNRYDKRQLVIDNSELAALRTSGIYRTGDSIGFAHAVAELYGFEVLDTADEIHLRKRTR